MERRGPGYRVFEEERADRMAELLGAVRANQEAIKALSEGLTVVSRNVAAIAESLGAPVVAAAPRIEQIPFSQSLVALQGAKIYEDCPFKGRIISITIHWPPGCNALVDVAVWHGRSQLCPREGYLALDNATPTYLFNEPVEEGEEIWVEMRNGDAVNSHSISCTVSVKEA